MRARDNPFATARVHRIRYRFDGLSWEQFMAKLAERNFRGAIVGPEGAGKSTLLEDLHPRLAKLGFEPVPLRLTQDAPRFTGAILRELKMKLTARHVVLLDGAEQMSCSAWWSFRWHIRRAGGLIITAHRTGLLPTVLTCGTTTELLLDLVSRLLGQEYAMSEEELDRLFHRHRGNIREALRELYDTWSVCPRDCLFEEAHSLSGNAPSNTRGTAEKTTI
jgi:hypothetical protein